MPSSSAWWECCCWKGTESPCRASHPVQAAARARKSSSTRHISRLAWTDGEQTENVGKYQSCMVSNLRMDYRWAGDGAWPTVSVLVPTCFHRRQLHPQVNM